VSIMTMNESKVGITTTSVLSSSVSNWLLGLKWYKNLLLKKSHSRSKGY
jgi:hypothetical protein